ncbi:translation elongation factor-like protein [Candidatus Saccharibacteria bacterium]|nr:translation elongation factor-like protein [Candidatus Saccharibacteria bacterium]
MAQKVLGKVIHYYDHLGVAVVNLAKGAMLKKGDKVHFKGNKTDFSQKVGSLQVNRNDVERVKAGDDFGVKVDQPVREGDQVHSTSE